MRDSRIGLCETLVALDCLAEETDGPIHRGVRSVPQVGLSAQVQVVRLCIAGTAALDQLPLLPAQADAQRSNELLRDLGLDREDVAEIPVIALRPQVIAVRGTHELRGDPHALTRLADAALEHRAYTERATDFAHVGGPALELERRGARGDPQVADAAQRVDDLLGDAVAEVLLVADRGSCPRTAGSRPSPVLQARAPPAQPAAGSSLRAPREVPGMGPRPSSARCHAASRRTPKPARRPEGSRARPA